MKYETEVCIVGAGPAGMVLGLLLARMGRKVLVLEHHPDFEREYRGEVLMPRFTQMMRQTGLFTHLEKYPHLKLTELEGHQHGRLFLRIGFKEIAPEAPFAIWMPQPILLQALFDEAQKYPGFELWFGARAENLIHEGNRTTGVLVKKHDEQVEVRAKVTVGTDGRFSVVRKRGGFEIEDEQYSVDIVWFTIPRPSDYDNRVRFYLSKSRNSLVLPKYPDLLQCGVVVPKDGFHDYVRQGIESFRKVLLQGPSLFHPFAQSLKDFTPFNVLQAKIEYVKQWAKDGVLLVGDSAHTCSPAGAVGVSVAVGSAIVAADVIEDCLKRNDFSEAALGRVQKIRAREVRHILSLQKAFGALLLPDHAWKKALMPFLLRLAVGSGLFRKVQRDLLVMKEPLPVSEAVARGK